jgi:hypothetical protein
MLKKYYMEHSLKARRTLFKTAEMGEVECNSEYNRSK